MPAPSRVQDPGKDNGALNRPRAMRTIALLAQKGGAGKTTLAVHLAVLASGNQRVLLVDTDPQKSAGDWWRARASATPVLVETAPDRLRQVIAAARADDIDLVVVDSAPHADPATVTATARAADLVLVPCRPAILDLRAIGATVDLVRAVRSAVAIILNAVPPRRGDRESGIVTEARMSLRGYGVPVAPPTLAHRVAFSHALIGGQGVTEYEPRGLAAREVRALFRWIRKTPTWRSERD